MARSAGPDDGREAPCPREASLRALPRRPENDRVVKIIDQAPGVAPKGANMSARQKPLLQEHCIELPRPAKQTPARPPSGRDPLRAHLNPGGFQIWDVLQRPVSSRGRGWIANQKQDIHRACKSGVKALTLRHMSRTSLYGFSEARSAAIWDRADSKALCTISFVLSQVRSANVRFRTEFRNPSNSLKYEP